MLFDPLYRVKKVLAVIAAAFLGLLAGEPWVLVLALVCFAVWVIKKIVSNMK